MLKKIEDDSIEMRIIYPDDNNPIMKCSPAFIVVGGATLSRGLTLEGLSVSYYWRKSQNYDSLLQMARWFGYRNGWIDVCRIYTSSKFMRDFITVGKVLERFKLDLASMYNDNLNPRDVGQRILYSSNLLLPS